MTPLEILLENPLVPVFFHPDIETCKTVLKATYDGGVRVFEFTNRGENALEVFSELTKYAKQNCSGLIIGIGTIFNAESAQQFIDAGADFVVQPFTTPEVGEVCKKNNIVWIPGTMTVTEIQNATVLGAEIVKIFPGNVLGSAYIKSLRGPLPKTKIMVTGGVEPTEASIKEWFGAGVNAVGLGSQLFKNIDKPQEITQTLNEIFKIVKA
jgi:2-dehydro-3-deoxyphosphogluconate aldolase/(4S)-4-hydroxy-2-oxoglutarate aldolase